MTRSKVKIIEDILETVKTENSCTKTRILRFANLDWDMTSRYLNNLIKEGFLEMKGTESEENGRYKITKRGELLLESLKKVRNICSIL